MAKGKWQMGNVTAETEGTGDHELARDARAAKAKKRTDTRERAFQFSLRVIHLCDSLSEKPGSGRILSRQLLRSATSIGANLEEAQGAHSKPDFVFKTEIALKEARETCYWLRLIAAANFVPASRMTDLQKEANELARIVAAIIITAKSRLSAR